ncbi:MAG: DegT/DnrJ/EryC1/StrS family aminotransferase [Bryobacterales bacterium]|nr:DegT/DnrJ/EryC1/StrS family aminotransferase [Bryobacterales bacterium]
MERRTFAAAASLAAAAAATPATGGRPALLGGDPGRTAKWPSWPKWDSPEEQALLGVLRSGHWGRGNGKAVEGFEKSYAALTGARHALATANGTSALFASINAMGVAPGDEVIVPPYTFVATVNIVLLNYALPVFADTDIETFMMDPKQVSGKITDRTSLIIPVHMAGSAADLDGILAAAKPRNVPVLEDACQAHLGEWRGRKVGTWGKAGCFSFQASKNLNSGEGGAIITNDQELFERAYAFHGNGRPYKVPVGGVGDSFPFGGANLRLTEFQGALLSAQMTRLEAQARTRDENAKYLTGVLSQIPGIRPAKLTPGCTRSAWHLYMFRYDAAAFAGLSRARFLKALAAEGIPASSGYTPLNKQPFIAATLASKGYQRLFPAKTLKEWADRNACPANDRLCNEAVWFTQNIMLGSRSDMDQIAEAIAKIQKQAGDLKQA